MQQYEFPDLEIVKSIFERAKNGCEHSFHVLNEWFRLLPSPKTIQEDECLCVIRDARMILEKIYK